MFYIEGDTINLSIGDTGTFKVKTQGSCKLDPTKDRVLFTIRNSSGTAVLERILTPADDSTNTVTVSLSNEDTDYLKSGSYTYDVRYVVNPKYDTEGRIFDGDRVVTPKKPQTFNLLSVVGEI